MFTLIMFFIWMFSYVPIWVFVFTIALDCAMSKR